MIKTNDENLQITKKDLEESKNKLDATQVSLTPEENEKNSYPLEVKIEGYCIRHTNGKMEFIPKQRRKVVNGLVSVKQTDETTIKTNKNYVQVIMTVKRESFNFQKYMSILNEIYLNLRSLKIL